MLCDCLKLKLAKAVSLSYFKSIVHVVACREGENAYKVTSLTIWLLISRRLNFLFRSKVIRMQ